MIDHMTLLINYYNYRTFTTNDGMVEIPVGVSVCGNLHIIVHHIKSVPGIRTTGMVHCIHVQVHIVHVYVLYC